MVLEKFLSAFMQVWVVLVFLFNVLAMAGLALKAPSFWWWIGKVQETYNPMNLSTYLINIVLISPALGANWLRGKLEARRISRRAAETMTELT